MDIEFFDLWPEIDDSIQWPALFLNGTHQETGRRIITSNVKIDGYFTEAYDFFDIHSGSIRLSTAVLNSARFAYVSPAGTLKKNDTSYGHVIDGGYFENYGAETAREIVELAPLKLGSDLEPILIQISSDPELKPSEVPSALRCGDSVDIQLLPGYNSIGDRFVHELKAPIAGMLNTRQSRGVFAAYNFANENCDNYFHFRMCPKLDSEPPLGWLLSKKSRQHIYEQLTCGCGNGAEFSRLLEKFVERGISVTNLPSSLSCPEPWADLATTVPLANE